MKTNFIRLYTHSSLQIKERSNQLEMKVKCHINNSVIIYITLPEDGVLFLKEMSCNTKDVRNPLVYNNELITCIGFFFTSKHLDDLDNLWFFEQHDNTKLDILHKKCWYYFSREKVLISVDVSLVGILSQSPHRF